jgi:hypothetical protein
MEARQNGSEEGKAGARDGRDGHDWADAGAASIELLNAECGVLGAAHDYWHFASAVALEHLREPVHCSLQDIGGRHVEFGHHTDDWNLERQDKTNVLTRHFHDPGQAIH